MAKQPPCIVPTSLNISKGAPWYVSEQSVYQKSRAPSSTITSKTVRPSSLSGSSAFDNTDASVSCIRDTISALKPLKGLPVECDMWPGCAREFNNASFTSGETFPFIWEVSILFSGFIWRKESSHWLGGGGEFSCLKWILKIWALTLHLYASISAAKCTQAAVPARLAPFTNRNRNRNCIRCPPHKNSRQVSIHSSLSGTTSSEFQKVWNLTRVLQWQKLNARKTVTDMCWMTYLSCLGKNEAFGCFHGHASACGESVDT